MGCSFFIKKIAGANLFQIYPNEYYTTDLRQEILHDILYTKSAVTLRIMNVVLQLQSYNSTISVQHLYFVYLDIILFKFYSRPEPNSGANTTETIVISLISILIEGPDVSLNGSPTVSPTTVAL